MRVIAIINEKGGVGKTTTTANLGGAIAAAGKKVLLIDIDKQSSLTKLVGFKVGDSYQADKTVNEVLMGVIEAKEAIYPKRKNLWVMPSSSVMGDTEYALFLKMGREKILKNAMADVNKYDYILIDCPPSLGLITVNALAFASEIFVVMQPEPSSLQGMDQLLKSYAEIKKNINHDLEVTGVVFSMAEPKTIHRQIEEHLRENLKDLVFKTVVPRRVVYTEASGQGQLIDEYRPKSEEAEIMRSLASEVMKRKKK